MLSTWGIPPSHPGDFHLRCDSRIDTFLYLRPRENMWGFYWVSEPSPCSLSWLKQDNRGSLTECFRTKLQSQTPWIQILPWQLTTSSYLTPLCLGFLIYKILSMVIERIINVLHGLTNTQHPPHPCPDRHHSSTAASFLTEPVWGSSILLEKATWISYRQIRSPNEIRFHRLISYQLDVSSRESQFTHTRFLDHPPPQE